MPSKDLESIRKSRREWYYRNKSHAKAEVQRRKIELVVWFAEYKSTLSCTSCGFSHPAVLDFHHIDPASKEYDISRMVTDGYSKDKILEEIDKCGVLCSNCHRILHYEMRS